MAAQRISSWSRVLTVLAGPFLVAALAGGAGAQSGFTAEQMEIFQKLDAQAAEMKAGKHESLTRGIGRGVGVYDGRDTGTGDAGITVSGSGQGPSSPVAPPVYDRDITVDLHVTFETNSAYIRESAAKELNKLCGPLDGMPSSYMFNIIGHADASGTPEVNVPLSEARAREVARHLERQCGIDGSRFVTYGLGASRLLPGVPEVSEQNRRVEVQVAGL